MLIPFCLVVFDFLVTGLLVWFANSGDWAEHLARKLGALPSSEGGYHIRAFTLIMGAFGPTIALCTLMCILGYGR